MELIKLTPQEWDQKTSENSVVILGAEWCMPCKALKMNLAKVENKLPVKVHLFDIDQEGAPEILQKYNIYSVPNILFFKKDGTIEQKTGGVSNKDFIETVNDLYGAVN